MEALVKHLPSFPLLELRLAAGETLVAEAGSMVARDAAVRMHVALDVGAERGAWARLRALAVAALRKLVGGEHFFVNRFSAPQGGWVWIAPALAGELTKMSLREDQAWTLVPGAFVAADATVHLRARWAGLSALLSRDAAFWVDVAGEGELWIAAHGAAISIEVDGTHVVDAGHLVGFSSALRARVRNARGGSAWRLRGEGTTIELSGRGRALVQSRSTRALVGFLGPLLPE